MRLAFYKGKDRFMDRLISWWTRGPYSHCEIVFGVNYCASSSIQDGGVRFKFIDLNPEHWDFMDVPGIDETAAFNWFFKYNGAKYDLLGLLGVISPIVNSESRWFCNEAMGAAMGIKEPWRFSPNGFACICEAMGGKWVSK